MSPDINPRPPLSIAAQHGGGYYDCQFEFASGELIPVIVRYIPAGRVVWLPSRHDKPTTKKIRKLAREAKP